MSEGTRIVLVKPGDALIFGNCADVDWDEDARAAIAELKDALGLASVTIYEDDVDLAALQYPDVMDREIAETEARAAGWDEGGGA